MIPEADRHLTDDQLVAILDGTVSIDTYVGHLDRCSVCRETLALARAAAPTVESAPMSIGRYEVRGLLGEGGMGVVYRAWDPDIHREVALKVWASTSTRAREKLLHEARVMGRLTHPGLATVHDAGHDDRFGTFIAVGLVEGQTLRRWARGPTTLRARIDVVERIAAAIVVAHEAGVAHGDLKPDNILVRRDGQPVIADFGLAIVDGQGPRGGTLGYAAPEQLETGASASADQYAFCVLAGELALPARLHRILSKGRRTDPSERWPDMRALLGAMQRRRGRGIGILAATLGVATVIAMPREKAPCALDPDAIEGRWHSTRVGLGEHEKARLDAYVARWVAAADESCATQQAESCLLRGRAELELLLDQLESGSTTDVVPWVASLPRPQTCFGPPKVPAPSSVLAEARARRLGGDPRDAARIAGQIAVRTDDPAIAAEAELLRGKSLFAVNVEDARQSLWRATVAATSVSRPDLEAQGLIGLAMLELRDPRQHQDAERLTERAASLVARHGLPLKPAIAYLQGLVAAARGDQASAIASIAKADALAEKQFPPGHPFRLQYAFEHAVALARASRYAESVQRLEGLATQSHDLLGGEHPRTAWIDAELGAQLANLGRWDDARPRLESALGRLETSLGVDSTMVLDTRRSLAIVLEEQKDYDRARELHLALHHDNDRSGRRGEAFRALCSAGDADFETDAFERAAERYTEALAYAERHDLARTGGCVARLGAAQARLDKPNAVATLERAVTLLDPQTADLFDASFARLELARVVGDPERARALASDALKILPSEGAVAQRRREAIAEWLNAAAPQAE